MNISLHNSLGYSHSTGAGNTHCKCKCSLYSLCWKCALLKNKRVESHSLGGSQYTVKTPNQS